MEEYKLDSGLCSAVVTDGGKNFVAAINNFLEVPRVGCAAHMLQLAIEAAFKLPVAIVLLVFSSSYLGCLPAGRVCGHQTGEGPCPPLQVLQRCKDQL
jgi:hypothetical protein